MSSVQKGKRKASSTVPGTKKQKTSTQVKPKAAVKAGAKAKGLKQNASAAAATAAEVEVNDVQMADSDDPLKLAELFSGGGEEWLEILKPIMESEEAAAAIIGPNRPGTIVPVREMTFQALKPNPPENWSVVIFGQNPYPRLESATGVAMFDNTFEEWEDKRFGRVTSMRCIMKAACKWKWAVQNGVTTNDIRALLKKNKIVQPPQWFQAMLTQGVLLLNASLTFDTSGASKSAHTKFWKVVVTAILKAILSAKQQSSDEKHKGIVFAWWGSHAKALRKLVDQLSTSYPDVKIEHVDHHNPAAMGDIFCSGNHFGEINEVLESIGMQKIDWLPAVGWDKQLCEERLLHASRMGAFISDTQSQHKMFMERLQNVADEKFEDIEPITGIEDLPVVSLQEATEGMLKSIQKYLNNALSFANKLVQDEYIKSIGLTEDEIGAVYLYTCESPLYKKLNEALRDASRTQVKVYQLYLRLFLSALQRIQVFKDKLWRGVALDLRKQYLKGTLLTWWGVSSCTATQSVASGFAGGGKHGMLFEIIPVRAVSISQMSAFSGEDEYILSPGTQLRVDKVSTKGKMTTVVLVEVLEDRMVR